MTQKDNFVRQWGSSNLFRMPDALLKSVDIPEDAKLFLSNVGLPKAAELAPNVFSIPLLVGIEEARANARQHELLSPAPVLEPDYSPFMASSCLMLTRLMYAYHYSKLDFWDGKHPLYFAVETSSGRVLVVGSLALNLNLDIYRSDCVENSSQCFANSSVAQLMMFLTASRKFVAHYRYRATHAHKSIPALIDGLERNWQRSDPSAMDKDGWWLRVIESVRRQFESLESQRLPPR